MCWLIPTVLLLVETLFLGYQPGASYPSRMSIRDVNLCAHRPTFYSNVLINGWDLEFGSSTSGSPHPQNSPREQVDVCKRSALGECSRLNCTPAKASQAQMDIPSRTNIPHGCAKWTSRIEIHIPDGDSTIVQGTVRTAILMLSVSMCAYAQNTAMAHHCGG